MSVRPRAASISVVLVAFGFLLGGALPVHAAAVAAPRLGIRLLDTTGAYVSLTLRPGTTKKVHLELGNYGTTRATARSYVADVYSMIDGGMGVGLWGAPTDGTTAWLSYPATTLDLDPRQAVPEMMTVSVPATAAPGDYISALVIEGDAGTSQSGDAAFKQVDRQAVAVAIRVPGPLVPGLSLPTAALRTTPGGVSYLDLGVSNNGNVHLHLAGTYTLLGPTGAQVAGGPVVMDTVYAHTSTTLAVPLAVALTPGAYTVSLTLSDPKEPVSGSSGPLPLDIASPVALLTLTAPASTAGLPSSSVDLVPMIVITLGIGLALGVTVASAASIVYRRSRRRQPSTTTMES
jgi:hypothetical protein